MLPAALKDTEQAKLPLRSTGSDLALGLAWMSAKQLPRGGGSVDSEGHHQVRAEICLCYMLCPPRRVVGDSVSPCDGRGRVKGDGRLGAAQAGDQADRAELGRAQLEHQSATVDE